MNELELKNIWKAYDKKLESLLHINYEQLKTIESERAESKIRSFVRGHLAVMLLGMLWIGLLVFLAWHMRDNLYFSVSVGCIILFNVFAVAAYLRHIVIVTGIDVAGNVVETQQQLARVNTSYINVGRILLLQTPFYCTWWYTSELVQDAGVLFWTIQAVVVFALTAFVLYLFVKLSPNNKQDHWARRVDGFFGASQLQNAIAFLDKVEQFKQENGMRG